ncbi:MAG: hypothetical protein WAU60_01435 [Candidatus Competibacter denitrificans]|jgi:hypothetical protein
MNRHEPTGSGLPKSIGRPRGKEPPLPRADAAKMARVQFEGFSAELKAALKTAAKRNGWVAEDWPLQVQLVQAALFCGWDEVVLVNAYACPPPGLLEAVL